MAGLIIRMATLYSTWRLQVRRRISAAAFRAAPSPTMNGPIGVMP